MERNTYSGTILKALRLHYNYTQSEFASILGVSQASLSKIEAHQIGLSADQWISLCIRFSMDPHCLSTGIIQALPRNISESGYKLPKIYSGKKVATVRYIYPFIKLMKKTLGENYYQKFLKDKKLDFSYFVILSNPINTDLIQLFFNDLYRSRKINSEIFSELLELLKHEDISPSSFKTLAPSSSVEEKYQQIFNLFYDHFDQEIEMKMISGSTLMATANSADSEMADFYSKFKIDYLATFIEQFKDQFQDNHWQFKTEKTDKGWGLFRAI